MATIIDSLLVTLGIDSHEFSAGKSKVDKGLRDMGAEADKAGAKLKKSGKDGADGFENVAKSATKFLALIGSTLAVKKFVQDTIESSAALDRLSQNLGQTVGNISAWSNAAELAGGSAEGLQGTMDLLSKSQTELMLTGQSGLIPYLSALGVSLADVQGKSRPVNDLLLDLSDRFSKMDRTTANNMGRMMGIDQGTMQLLLKGRSEVELLIARQKEYGAVTKQQAEEATRLRNAMVAGKQSFEAFGRTILSAATPAIEKLFSVFSDLGAWMRDNQEFVKTFLTVIAVGLAGIAAETIPINLTAAAVLGLAAGIAALWDDYRTWKSGGDSFFGDDWKMIETGVHKAGEAIKWLRDMMGDLIYRAIAAADAVGAVLSGDFERAKFAAGEVMGGTGKKYGEASKSAASTAPGVVKDSQSAAMAYFEAQGWTKAQAAGLVANISRESSFNPAAVGDNGKAYGIGQWHPDRQAEFQKKFGKPMQGSSFEDQLAFMQYELTQGNEKAAGIALRGAVTGQRAGEIVSSRYERPADVAGEARTRGLLARDIAMGIPGASQAAAGAGAIPAAQANAAGAGANVSKSVETHIGEVKVYTAATDAPGIAKDMGKSLDYLFTSQANYGLM